MWLQSQTVIIRHLYIMLHGEYNTYRYNMSVYVGDVGYSEVLNM